MSVLPEDPEVLSTELLAHLRTISHDNTQNLNADLCDRTTRSLTPSTPRSLLLRILDAGESILPTLATDPTPLTRLLSHVVSLLPFTTLQPLISSSKLITGLVTENPPVQILCLAYLLKAASTPSGAAFVATDADLVRTLVSTWLSTQSTEVSERGLDTIIALLSIDKPSPIFSSPPQSQATRTSSLPIHSRQDPTTSSSTTTHRPRSTSNAETPLFWRRILHDPSIYELLFLYTTPNPTLSAYHRPQPMNSKHFNHRLTTSQARLLDFLICLATISDLTSINQSYNPELESKYASTSPSAYSGLLAYATSPDTLDLSDPLMNALREDFFVRLLKLIEEWDGLNQPQPGLSAELLDSFKRDAGETYQLQLQRQQINGRMHL